LAETHLAEISFGRKPIWPKLIWPNRPNWPKNGRKFFQNRTEQNINLTLSQKITLKLQYIVPFAEVNDKIIYIVKISPNTNIRDPIKKNFHYIIHGIFRTFSQKMQNLPFCNENYV
jgi:hypothetical protein